MPHTTSPPSSASQGPAGAAMSPPERPDETLLSDVRDSVAAAHRIAQDAQSRRAAALTERDDAIRRALNGGWSMRKVSRASGLSVAQVQRVRHGQRSGRPAERPDR